MASQARLRVLFGSAITMGPGKAALLRAIKSQGSISKAARSMGMSYRRAWSLVETMNSSFKAPLVISNRGGSGGGGAQLTALGLEAVERYQEMEAKANAAVAKEIEAYCALLAPFDGKSEPPAFDEDEDGETS